MSSSRDLYEILEVSRDATSGEIKKAYRRLALAHHPDKVSEEMRAESEIKFKEISHAYEVLADEDKRGNYDLYGDEDGRASYGDFNGFLSADAEFGPDDFFNFFNGAGATSRQQPPRQRRTKDAKISVEITLEDLYKGKVIKTTSTRNITCKSCKGSGVKTHGKQETCLMCNGEGQKLKLRRQSPGIFSQEYVTCNNCEGTGKVSKKKDRCKKCGGKRVREETKILEFNITKGSKPVGKVVLKGESDEEPGKVTGDVILNYTTKTHDVFEAKGDDLYFKLNIKLFEALCGFSKKNFLKTLDNRFLSLTIPPGKVLKPGDFIKVPNEGMPLLNKKKHWFGNGDEKGDLYIEIHIEFPQDKWFLEKNEYNTIKTILSNVQYPTKLTPDGEVSDDISSYVVDKFIVINQKDLPRYEDNEEREQDEEELGDDYYGSSYYENVGPQPECQQQ